jgi:hypothetical protein
MGLLPLARHGVLGVALLLAAACGSKKDPVLDLLARLEEAAEARDVDAFAEGLSADFRGGGLSRAAALSELRRYFAMYETVALEVYGVEVERSDGGKATVRCVVEFSGQGTKLGGLDKLLPPEAAYRFQLEMADDGGTWRVKAASWEQAAPPAPAS